MAFHASLMQGKAADCHVLFRMIGEIEVSRDRFRCIVVFLHVTKVFSELAAYLFSLSPIYNFLQRVQVMQ